MFKDRTKVVVNALKIASLDSKIAYFGSCFAEHGYNDLKKMGLPVSFSPFGISYNSASLTNQLHEIINESRPRLEDLVQTSSELWASYKHHGDYSHPEKTTAFQKISCSFDRGVRNLKELDFLVVSLGTSFCYRLKSDGEVVNNCHKQPSELFTREFLSCDDQLQGWHKIITELKTLNPKLHLILTVSPIRHLRDSAPQNSRSKAALITAAHELTIEFEHCHYFPAYEIMMDELRDYRFYASDLCHPSDIATKYICEHFRNYLYKDTTALKRISHFIARKNHDIKYSGTSQARAFLQDTANEQTKLMECYPFLNFMD